MVKPKELRIGNTLEGGTVWQFDNSMVWFHGRIGQSFEYNNPLCSSVELTEEIITKCEVVSYEHFYEDIKNYSFEINGIHFNCNSSNYFRTLEAHPKYRMPVIRYLHQLENIYFALTGKELIINP